VLELAKVPSIRLCASHLNLASQAESRDESFLGIGISDGSILILRQKTLAKISYIAPCHYLPVTGMGFCPVKGAMNGDSQLLLSCSMDKVLAANYVTPSNTKVYLLSILAIVIIVLLVIILYYPELFSVLRKKFEL
jgi:hypothetical protein